MLRNAAVLAILVCVGCYAGPGGGAAFGPGDGGEGDDGAAEATTAASSSSSSGAADEDGDTTTGSPTSTGAAEDPPVETTGTTTGATLECPEVVLEQRDGVFFNCTAATPVRWFRMGEAGTRYLRVEVEFDFTFPQWREGAVPSTEYAFEYFVWHLFSNYNDANSSNQEAAHWGWLNGNNIRNKTNTLAYSTFFDFQWVPPQTFAAGDWEPGPTYHVHAVNDTVGLRLQLEVTKDGAPFHDVDQPLALSPEAPVAPSEDHALQEAYTGGLKLMLGKPEDSDLIPPRPVPYHMIPLDFTYSNLRVVVIEDDGECVPPA